MTDPKELMSCREDRAGELNIPDELVEKFNAAYQAAFMDRDLNYKGKIRKGIKAILPDICSELLKSMAEDKRMINDLEPEYNPEDYSKSALTVREKQLVQALRFYASPEAANHVDEYGCKELVNGEYADFGNFARETLAEIERG